MGQGGSAKSGVCRAPHPLGRLDYGARPGARAKRGLTFQLDHGVEQGPSLWSIRMGLLAAGGGKSLNVLGGSKELGLWSQTWLGSQA